MAKNTSVILGDHFEKFVGTRVANGRYGSTSEVLRAALRLLEEYEAQQDALRQALVDGETSGSAGPFDPDAFLKNLHAKHAGTE